MIGGHDVVVREKASLKKVGEMLSRIGSRWPSAVMDVEGHDLFVYESVASRESWQRSGRTRKNDGEMVHLVLGEESTTIVVDGRGSELCAFVEQMVATLWPEWTPGGGA